MPVPGTDGTIRVVTSLEYFAFGTPVSISAPAGDVTVPFATVEDQWRAYFDDLQATTGADAV